jgi:hypothetical protein
VVDLGGEFDGTAPDQHHTQAEIIRFDL